MPSCLPGITALLTLTATLNACGSGAGGAASRINGSIHVAAGTPAGAAATINGSIVADDNAALMTARTVNGGITIGRHASAESLTTVNGPILLRAGARVTGGVTVVNGAIRLDDGAKVSGTVANVSGAITLTSAQVSGGITTVDGNVSVLGQSHVEGGIAVKKPSGIFFHVSDAVPRIIIGPGAVVDGALRFDRAVTLYVSDQAKIGPVSGATPVAFAGAAPPGVTFAGGDASATTPDASAAAPLINPPDSSVDGGKAGTVPQPGARGD